MTTGMTITPSEPEWFDVQLEDGATATSYRVRVPAPLLEELGLADADRELVVRETFAFLLEREPPSSILGEFALDVVPRYFPEFYDELRRRLGR
jgi:bifunctional DNA-binding transcriptional regulator/antitoxin component of YhaV-PrlF toxin-antitoxin module